jgi:hypothetical protein
MFSVDTEVHCPPNELKTIYKEAPETDSIQATANKNVSALIRSGTNLELSH